jgi:protein TonB
MSVFFGDGKSDYGRKSAIILSVAMHLLIVGSLVAVSIAGEAKPDAPPQAMRVKLGGPDNLSLGGPKRKAPVAGVNKTKKTPPKVVQKPKPKKRRPAKTKEKKVGLNREKKAKPTPKKAEPAPDKVEREGKVDTAPQDDRKGNRAAGGLGGDDTGISLEVGDGATDINVEDVEFISYWKLMRAEIAGNWARRGLVGGKVRIRFHINRDGSITDVVVAESSGHAFLDSPARRAVMVSELPPLPQGYEHEYLVMHLDFHYKK